MLASGWPLLLACAVQFFLSFAGLRSRTIENIAAVQWVVLPTSLVVAGPEHLFAMALFWYFLLAFELTAVMAIYLAVTRRQRPQDYGPMALAIAAGEIALIGELGVRPAGLALRLDERAPDARLRGEVNDAARLAAVEQIARRGLIRQVEAFRPEALVPHEPGEARLLETRIVVRGKAVHADDGNAVA
jgi:hypothetical protein